MIDNVSMVELYIFQIGIVWRNQEQHEYLLNHRHCPMKRFIRKALAFNLATPLATADVMDI